MIARRRHVQYATTWLPILVLAAAQPALAQQRTLPTNWDNIKQFAPGAEIRVEVKDRRSVRGQFDSVTDDSLLIHSSKGQETLTRQTVARVWAKRRSHRARNALIGLGLGAGAGLAVGAVAEHNCTGLCFNHLPEEVFTPLGAIVGGIIGAVIPTGRWREVYRTQ